MPISNTDLQELAKVSLDEYLRNLPVDQIAVERPFLKKLMQGRKSLLGAKQNVVENIRKEHGSNFTWAFGEETVKFNKRNTTEQASFPWRRAVDGLYIDYDRLFSNGIKVREGGARGFQLEYNERVQLINLLDEQLEVLREGFLNKLDLELHRDGSHGADAVVGLDIHVHVPPYETNILRNLFGRENVTVFERQSKTTITPEQEYDRLCAKYGHEVVAKVFGEDDGDRLMEIVEGLMSEKVIPEEPQIEKTPEVEIETKGAKKR